jgi:hypothetical protein
MIEIPIESMFYCSQPGTDSPCQYGITIYRPENNWPVVVVTELPVNMGMSVTNAISWLLPKIAIQYGLDKDAVTWVEHYPERGGWMGDETFDLVDIHWEKGSRNYLRAPNWRRLFGNQVEQLIQTGNVDKVMRR